MAHFAALDKDNIVTRIYVVDNSVMTDENGDEKEQLGIDFLCNLHNHLDSGNVLKQTSYNGTIRKNYANPGYIYDNALDAFIPPKKKGEESFTLNEDTCQWEAPLPYPDDGKLYTWSSGLEKWIEVL
jgi:hypothetical protein